MELKDIRRKEEFPSLYEEKGLKTLKEKIEFLWKEMGIVAAHSVEEFTPEEELLTLQQYALYGWSRG